MRSIPAPHKPGTVRDLLTIARPVADLPDTLTELLDTADRLDRTRADIADPQPPPPSASRLLDGDDPVDVVVQDRDHKAAIEAAKAARSLCHQTAIRQQKLMDEHLRDHADDIIEGPVRDLVDQLLDQARTHVKTLARFAPTFDRTAILDTGTPKELKAYQQATTEPQQTFGIALALWDHTATQAFVHGPHRTDRAMLPDGPAGIATWDRPDLVHDVELREGIYNGEGRPRDYIIDLLRIAAAPVEAGYRLASPTEIVEHHRSVVNAELAERRKYAGQARILTGPKVRFLPS